MAPYRGGGKFHEGVEVHCGTGHVCFETGGRGIPVAEVRWKAGIFPLIDKVRPDLEISANFSQQARLQGFGHDADEAGYGQCGQTGSRSSVFLRGYRDGPGHGSPIYGPDDMHIGRQ